MNYKHTPNERQAIISLHRNGKSVANISLEAGVPRSTIYNWLKEESCNQDTPKELSLKNFRMLERKVERLEEIIEILKTAGCLPSDSLNIKLKALDVPHGTSYVTSARTHLMLNIGKDSVLSFSKYMTRVIKFLALKRYWSS